MKLRNFCPVSRRLKKSIKKKTAQLPREAIVQIVSSTDRIFCLSNYGNIYLQESSRTGTFDTEWKKLSDIPFGELNKKPLLEDDCE